MTEQGVKTSGVSSEEDISPGTGTAAPRRSQHGRHVALTRDRRRKKQEYVLSERVLPEWYHWAGVSIPAVIAVITCIKRADEYGASAWAANGIVMLICITVVGTVTYFSNNNVAERTAVYTIILGSLPMAALTHPIPPLETAYGSLWTGSFVGLFIGGILTVGQRR